jgi:hypothetical protein
MTRPLARWRTNWSGELCSLGSSVILTITMKDIRAGEPARHERDCDLRAVYPCPVTIALTRALMNTPCPGGCDQVCVSIGTHIGVGDPYPTKVVEIPAALVDWMRRWDTGERMKPATFEVPGL